MSIDTPSAQNSGIPGDDFNYIDSYVEYITEVILKYENAIPESKNRQQKDLQVHKHIQVICQALKLPKNFTPETVLIKKVYPDYLLGYTNSFIKKINPPPPKFV